MPAISRRSRWLGRLAVARRSLMRLTLLIGILLALPAWTGAIFAAHAASESIDINNARFVLSGNRDAWVLSADFTVPLHGRLEDAVNQGVALNFVVDVDVYRSRWYWWDERLTQASQTYRLSYHALTRQYRVTVNGFQQSFPTLSDALRGMSMVRAWKIMDLDRPKPGVSYDAYVRMRLDLAQLPKPFQITALTNRDWNLQAEWKRFTFNPETSRSVQ
jgi:Domain of unknown function (DUF4390)